MTGPVHIFSSGLWRLRDEVAAITGMTPERALLFAGRQGAVAGWGHKPTAARARREASRRGLPYLAFEDGFLRSLRPGPAQRPMSMILDRQGIYYDARTPSDLETMLETANFTGDELSRAGEIVTEISRRRLSKYNHGADQRDAGIVKPSDRLVLVVDQTFGDESVAGGLADTLTFQRMIAAAVAENPGASVIAKLHPEVISGAKRGYLRDEAQRLGVTLLSTDASPWALLDHNPHVYTVSSQLGFEALLAGCRVTCFGAPFYAGWGLTDDRAAIPRRSRRLGRDHLAAAVYLRYSHYFDCWRRTPVDALTAIDQLDFLRRNFLGNTRAVVGYRIARWKRKAVTAMLDGLAGPPVFTNRLDRAVSLARRTSGAIAAWGREASRLRRSGALGDIPSLAVEDGFIRSAGLGAAFVQPMSLVFDSRGIYYDPSGPSDIEHMLAASAANAGDVARAAALRQRITAERITKYNLSGDMAGIAVPVGREAILVPGQVADDAAVIASAEAGLGAGSNVNAMLLAAVRARNPQAFVIFKPHPDVEKLGRRGALTEIEERHDADHVARETPIDVLLSIVQRVETFSSLAGFEALLRGLPVTVHGMPFYAGWGVTEDLVSCARRGTRRSLDELTAAALIGYPRYWDPVSGLPCPPEVVLDRIAVLRKQAPSLKMRAGQLAGRLIIGWRTRGVQSGPRA